MNHAIGCSKDSGLQTARNTLMVDDSRSCGPKVPAAPTEGAHAPSGPVGYNLRKRDGRPVDAAKLVAASPHKRPRIAIAKSGGKDERGKVGAEVRHQPSQDVRTAFALEFAQEMVAGMAPKTPQEVLGVLSSLGVAASTLEHVRTRLPM
jgi:hypothetical protein